MVDKSEFQIAYKGRTTISQNMIYSY